jgi:hypothetical protein
MPRGRGVGSRGRSAARAASGRPSGRRRVRTTGRCDLGHIPIRKFGSEFQTASLWREARG